MSTRRCPLHGGPMRKSVRVLIPDGAGGVRGALVCQACARKGIIVVPQLATTACGCGQPATTCGRCVDKAAAKPGDLQVEVAKKLRKMSKAYDGTEDVFSQGRANGLEQAADILEAAGRKGAAA